MKEDGSNVLIKCIEASRALAELKGSLSRHIPGSLSKYILLQETRSVLKMCGSEIGLGDLYKASSARELGRSRTIEDALKYSAILKKYAEMDPSANNIYNIYQEIWHIEKHSNEEPLPEQELDGLKTIDADEDDSLIKTIDSMLFLENEHPFGSDHRVYAPAFFMLLNRYGLLQGCNLLFFTNLAGHRDEFRRLTEKVRTTGRTEDWKMFILDRIRDSSIETMSMMFSLEMLMDDADDRYSELPAYSKELMEVLFSDVYIKGSDLISAGIAERVTAMKYLRSFKSAGLLKSEKIGREVLFENKVLSKLFGITYI